MKIALDYDDTFTEDRTFWAEVALLAKRRGHSITFVTFRHENGNYSNDDIEEDSKLLDIDIVYCGFKQKAGKFEADVWIDDSPHFIPTADKLKKHCEYYDVNFQLTHPLIEQFVINKGTAYTGTVSPDGKVELFDPEGIPCPRKKFDRFGQEIK